MPSYREIMRKLHAFTLIELLVTVAIISILAAIALPNFLEAQIRAKIARAKAEMKVIEVGLELYCVDEGWYPPARIDGKNLDKPLSSRLSRLTTPVAYLNILPRDIFPAINGWNGARLDADLQMDSFDTYDYFDAKSDWDEDMRARVEEGTIGTDSTRGCQWRLSSAGPDLWASFGIVWGPYRDENDRDGMDYDASNGTISWGDIVHTGARMRNWSEEAAMRGE